MTTILQNIAYLERAYLGSIANMFIRYIVHPSYEKVSNTYKDNTVLHFSSTFGTGIEARLSIYRGAEAHALTWDQISYKS